MASLLASDIALWARLEARSFPELAFNGAIGEREDWGSGGG